MRSKRAWKTRTVISGLSAAVCPGSKAATISGHCGLQVSVIKNDGAPLRRATSKASKRSRRRCLGEPGTLDGKYTALFVVPSACAFVTSSQRSAGVTDLCCCCLRRSCRRSSSMRQYMLISHSLNKRPQQCICSSRSIICRYRHICETTRPSFLTSVLQPRPPCGNQSGKHKGSYIALSGDKYQPVRSRGLSVGTGAAELLCLLGLGGAKATWKSKRGDWKHRRM